MVTVRFFATIRAVAGEKELKIDAGTVGELINKLITKYDSPFEKQISHATFLINGTNITHLKGRNTKLKDGDVISIFPPLGGG